MKYKYRIIYWTGRQSIWRSYSWKISYTKI